LRPELVAEVKFPTWTEDNLLRKNAAEARSATVSTVCESV
jgi:hypothetical protein